MQSNEENLNKLLKIAKEVLNILLLE